VAFAPDGSSLRLSLPARESSNSTPHQVKGVLDGDVSVSWTLAVRVREGRVRSYLRSHFGNVKESFDRIATMDDVRPRVEEWLGQVRERRNQMGKR
jgi:hypothetical protein